MHYSAFLNASLLFASALGVAVGGGQATTKTKASCITQMGTKPIHYVPTSRTTSTQNLPAITITKTAYATVKITPKPKTLTVTKYSIIRTTTTLRTITKGYTTTLTETSTSTSTNIETTTDTTWESATVTSTDTQLIPTPAGFTPVADTASRHPPVKRDSKKPVKGSCNDAKFPQAVTCKTVLQVKKILTTTVPGRPRTVTLPRKVVLSTTSVTVTKTITIPFGKVSSTATTTSTTTLTTISLGTTSTLTTSTTTLIIPATATAYAACAADNQLSKYNGNYIEGATVSYGDWSRIAPPADATACCSACQQLGSQGCLSYVYLNPGNCFIATRPASNCAPAYFETNPTALGAWTVGNGPCGWFYAGP